MPKTQIIVHSSYFLKSEKYIEMYSARAKPVIVLFFYMAMFWNLISVAGRCCFSLTMWLNSIKGAMPRVSVSPWKVEETMLTFWGFNCFSISFDIAVPTSLSFWINIFRLLRKSWNLTWRWMVLWRHNEQKIIPLCGPSWDYLLNVKYENPKKRGVGVGWWSNWPTLYHGGVRICLHVLRPIRYFSC